MPASLNIRDIGEDRKAALDAEAKARGLSAAEIVRVFIDEGLDQARREREKQEWMAEARAGIEAEHAYIEKHGPTLARYRKINRNPL